MLKLPFKSRLLLLCFFISAALSQSSFANSTAAAAQPWKTAFTQESEKSILIEIHIPEPKFVKNTQTGLYSQVNAGEGSFKIENSPLYGFSKILQLPEGARAEVFKKGEFARVKAGVMDLSFKNDVPLQPGNQQNSLKTSVSTAKKSDAPKQPFRVPEELLELKYLGNMRNAAVSSLVLKPYSYDAKTGEVTFFKTLTIRVTLPQATPLRTVIQSPITAFEKRTYNSFKKANSLLASQLLKKIPTAPDGYNYKIIVDKEGLVRVTADELLKAGVPLQSINSTTFSLWNKGVEIPVYVFDRGNTRLETGDLTEEYIEFFGEPNRQYFKNRDRDIYGDPETRENVYTLMWGGALGKRMVEESGDIKITDPARATDLRGQSFKSTVFVEENNLTENFGSAAFTKDTNKPSFQGDQSFWGRVQANQTASFPVELPAPNLLHPDGMKITAMLHGAPGTFQPYLCPGKFEHNAEIYINQHRALKASWNGTTRFKADEEKNGVEKVPMVAASRADNSTITVSNVFDCNTNGGPVPSFYVNWFQVSYQRQYRAFKNTIPFSIPSNGKSGLYTFYISDFTQSNVVLYRKGISRIINPGIRTIRPDSIVNFTRYTVSFQAYVASPDEQFYATSEDQVLKPKAVVREKASSLADANNDFDYIIITDTLLYNAGANNTNPIVKFKNFQQDAHGFKVLVADIAEVFNEFNYGVKSKEAIRSFLKHAYSEWKVSPRYAVLAGDVRNIPPDYWQTVQWGTTPTDYPYGLIDGYYRTPNGEIITDVFPEIIVGRIPATKTEDFDAFVEKIKMYEQNPDLDYYRSSAVLIAGDNSAFEAQSNDIATAIPASVSKRRVYVRSQSGKYFGGTSDLINEIDRGSSFINYMGHGGGGVWDDQGLFLPPDIQKLSNRGKYSIVSSPTCFTGAYESSISKGLLTSFIFEKDRGAVVAWGNSGFGWEENSYYFSKGILESFFAMENRGKTVGDLFADGKARYFAQYGGYKNEIGITMILQCNYLGDPALRFGVAKKKIDVRALKEFASAGEDISFSGTLPFTSGQGIAELFDEQENLIEGAEQPLNIQNGNFTGVLKIPFDFSGRSVGVRVYANDFSTANEVEGSITISTDSLVFVEAAPLPAAVQPAQPFDLQVKIHSRQPVSSAKVNVTITALDGTVFTDVIDLSAGAGNLFKTTRQVAGASATNGARVAYRFEAATSSGVYLSKEYAFVIGGTADPAAYPQTQADGAFVASGSRAVNSSIAIYPTPQGAQLGARVYNWGDNDAAAEVKFELLQNNQPQLIGTASVQIPAKGSTLAFTPLLADMLQLQNIRITVSATTGTTDQSQQNNISTNDIYISGFMLAPGIGSTGNGAAFSTVGVPQSATLEVAASAGIAQPSLVFLKADTVFSTVQPGVKLLKGTGFSSVTLSNGADNSIQGILKLWYNAADAGSATPAIYRYNSRSQTWTRFASTLPSAGVVAATVPLNGTYAVGISSDAAAPNTAISIEGQFFSNRGAVPPSPRITVVANDENGIDVDLDKIILEMDGNRILKNEYSVVDSMVTATSSGIVYQPSLANGVHTFCVSVADNNGNQSERDCVQMEISTEFQVRVLGQFPNPFKNQMFLAYDILGANTIDEIEVKFFTASGRTIRRMVYPSADPAQKLGLLQSGTGQPTSIGYHEAWWDGRDEEGNEVANGIYFYRIRVRSGDETIESLGKIARVR